MLKREIFVQKEKVSVADALDSKGCPRMLMGNNRNWICLLCGPTGTGKSYTALRLAELLDESFAPHKVVFSVQEFLQLFSRCRAGDFIIFDEGEEFNSRRAMKEGNVQMGIILSMLRFTQISVIFTLPSLMMIDINARRLAHAYLYTIEVDRRNAKDWRSRRSGVHWYNIRPVRLPQTNKDLLFVNPLSRRGVKWSKFWFRAPGKQLLAEYESRKREVFYRALSNAQSKLGLSDASVESTAHADTTRNERNQVDHTSLHDILIGNTVDTVSAIMRN